MNIPKLENGFYYSTDKTDDGPEVDVIRIEKFIRLMDDNEETLRNMKNMSNLHSVAGNMRHDPAPVVPILP